jgi:hypothetical protein
MSNPSDNIFAIVKELVEGTTPATPAFKYLDIIQGNELKLDSKLLSSAVLKQNRGMAGLAKVATSITGSLKTEFRRDEAYDMLLESALSGTFSGNVLKGSTTDSTYTIEKRMSELGVLDYQRFVGMTASKFGLTVDATSFVETTFDMIGMGRSNGSAIVTGATYTAPTQGVLLDGTDVGTITIAGLNTIYLSLELSVEHNREAKFALGNIGSTGTGTSGPRTIKLTMKGYRKGLTAYSASASDAPQAISFSIGTAANGYRFDLPAAVYSAHANDETNGSNAFVNLEWMCQLDPTAGTDIIITKLT